MYRKTHEHEVEAVIERPGATCNKEAREICLLGAVDESSMVQFVSGFRELDHDKGTITVVISSPGGDEAAGWAIYEHMAMAKNEVIAVAYSECMSIAALILQGASKRLVSPWCRFMIHNGSMGMESDVSRLMGRTKEILRVTSNYYSVLAQRSGHDLPTIKRMCDNEVFLSAQETVDLGFADGILLPGKQTRKTKKKR